MFVTPMAEGTDYVEARWRAAVVQRGQARSGLLPHRSCNVIRRVCATRRSKLFKITGVAMGTPANHQGPFPAWMPRICCRKLALPLTWQYPS